MSTMETNQANTDDAYVIFNRDYSTNVAHEYIEPRSTNQPSSIECKKSLETTLRKVCNNNNNCFIL